MLAATAVCALSVQGTAQAAEGPDVTATVQVLGGPYLLGQTVPLQLTVTNIGNAEATEVRAHYETVSGSHLSINSADWDGLQPPWGQPSTLTLAAGASRTFTLKGVFYQYAGDSKFNVRVGSKNDANPWNDAAPAQIGVVEPTRTGTLSGVVWGDANGNGTLDAGEGLAGAKIIASRGGGNRETTTGADGRYAFTELERAMWGVGLYGLPGGWVVRYSSDMHAVDGSGSTSDLRHQAVRPLTDQLSSSLRFTTTEHVDNGPIGVEFTLTNTGTTDLTGIKAGCNRSGEGPHVRLDLGELDYNGSGATVPAGQSRVFGYTGTVSPDASSYGFTNVNCDFGADELLAEGFPKVADYVKVGNRRTDTNGSIFVDTNGDGWMNDGERLTGVPFSLKDPKTGAIVGTAAGEAPDGRAYFRDIPAGRYDVVADGYRVVSQWQVVARDCTDWCQNGWTIQVVPA
ncbi:hypothetical protein BBK82_14205 [Lentzea guizhouensis]|uniref:SD-repeat containing protein B domain-containing protein n=1 Tax=Lentzea guizhouensis TaxID=1586287 RepID=A0A1B2HH66_9PSEU|nr:hypothetical protein BBK82_14205 [Lentzea guizhouensis]